MGCPLASFSGRSIVQRGWQVGIAVRPFGYPLAGSVVHTCFHRLFRFLGKSTLFISFMGGILYKTGVI